MRERLATARKKESKVREEMLCVQDSKAKLLAEKLTKRQLKRQRYNERKAEAKVSACRHHYPMHGTAFLVTYGTLWKKGR